jgi:succinate dehydrogenase / fumarate reductase cytochrome b subunit
MSFVNRRLHSLAGLFLVVFLIEHLLTNSQAALWFGDDGAGFIHAVNFIHSLPYLQLIEVFLLGVPVAIHAYLGCLYLYDGAVHILSQGGKLPSLQFSRNYAYVFQRLTSVVLIIGIGVHVLTMRILRQPETISYSSYKQYAVSVFPDPGLFQLAPRLHSTVVSQESKSFLLGEEERREAACKAVLHKTVAPMKVWKEQEQKDIKTNINTIRRFHVSSSSCVVISPDFGTATLFLVRDTMRRPWVCVLYSLFVLAASFHAANGIWTFAVAWGCAIQEKGRRYVRYLSYMIAGMLAMCGLASIWLTYWYNLYS